MGGFKSGKKKRYRVDVIKRPGKKDGYQIFDIQLGKHVGPVYDSREEADKICAEANLGLRL
ncbi:hypothetical protein QT562_04605 [Xanthomonas citri pv. citri]|uniref:Uncharacterized protein n=1 Tax=Xanthomonas citri pv. citri TaxID=611301 RepID=A0A0U5FDI3_XANCI|nr:MULTISPECIES: hypothetical protein [Xanthomonas]AGI08622.1 Hypothetical Protein XCAW_02845 [Xanthomonas citri subsp. citri Aw12879]AGH77003.1 hypothetical protein XAC29_07555 [Xanthomonas axonopodis Xac29-1]AJD68089.1 hypothetical protein J151_01644 [Xanthomonas citri subsp. citri A306]AJY81622.1 hypothetical protein J159_01640 [Xanthomonas citri pv. citri]AJY86044.1 hypothetical protein J158_01640 [Xanthomonas citri subsp. citri UI6]